MRSGSEYNLFTLESLWVWSLNGSKELKATSEWEAPKVFFIWGSRSWNPTMMSCGEEVGPFLSNLILSLLHTTLLRSGHPDWFRLYIRVVVRTTWHCLSCGENHTWAARTRELSSTVLRSSSRFLWCCQRIWNRAVNSFIDFQFV